METVSAQMTTLLLVLVITWSQAATNQTLVYSWVKVEYDWPNDTMRQEYITNEKFVVENNIVSGIKIYKDEVYVTVPRWRHGVPSALNRVVMKDGKPVIQPYPSWEYQRVGDCEVLQFVQSMEIDPNTGLMWIIDNGRINILDDIPPDNKCPPKLVIWDINKNRKVHSYIFPNDVANNISCFLNDIVLDYVDGEAKFAYITDTSDAKLYVYDYKQDTSYFFEHPSMRPTDPPSGFPINGIAISAKFDFVYYCPVSGFGLFQIPTFVLRDPQGQFSKHVRHVGNRSSRSDGLTYGQRSLFYGLLDTSGVERWLVAADSKDVGYDNVNLTTQEILVRNDITMVWVDTFAWGERGYLWFTANNMGSYLGRTMNFNLQSGFNMHVWKVFVNESSYLSEAGFTSSAHILNAGVLSVLLGLAALFIMFFVLRK